MNQDQVNNYLVILLRTTVAACGGPDFLLDTKGESAYNEAVRMLEDHRLVRVVDEDGDRLRAAVLAVPLEL